MKPSRTLQLIIIALTGAILISACEQSHTNNPVNGAQGDGQKPIPGLDFAAIQEKVFNDTSIDGRCSVCHGNWTRSYAATFSLAAEIRDRVLRAPGSPGFMPRQGTLPDEVRALLLTWIDSGAPEFAPSDEPATDESVDDISPE